MIATLDKASSGAATSPCIQSMSSACVASRQIASACSPQISAARFSAVASILDMSRPPLNGAPHCFPCQYGPNGLAADISAADRQGVVASKTQGLEGSCDLDIPQQHAGYHGQANGH